MNHTLLGEGVGEEDEENEKKLKPLRLKLQRSGEVFFVEWIIGGTFKSNDGY